MWRWVLIAVVGVTRPIYTQDTDGGYAEALRRIEVARADEAAVLDLSGLGLARVPPEVGTLPWLRVLLVSDNQLATVPPEIGNLTGLATLRLDNNALRDLPPEIGNLKRLESLYLDGNQLTTLPPELGEMEGLVLLFVHDNPLTTVSARLGRLPNLQTLTMSVDAGLIFPPAVVVMEGGGATLAFLREPYPAGPYVVDVVVWWVVGGWLVVLAAVARGLMGYVRRP